MHSLALNESLAGSSPDLHGQAARPPSRPAQGTAVRVRATGLDGDAFANRLLDAHRIAVMPGESFGAAAAGHVRVAMTIEDARFAEALTTLCDFARAQSGG